jgi:two-component system, cell cycle sensor histidine kinase and response regulator CckA
LAKAADLPRELVEARARIAQLEGELAEERRVSSLARLTASVAHDFGNVLAVIAGQNDLMLRAMPGGSPLRRGAESIQKAVQWGHRLAEQLLAHDRVRPEWPAADLNAVVAGVVRALGPLLGERIDVELQLDPAVRAVAVTAAAVEQVIMNLVLNARDAMPSGGRLSISTVPSSPDSGGVGTATLCVVDTGVGMDQATRARAFEPYFSTKPGGRGKGLGLSTVFGIVSQHGGHVDVTSEPGHGSTFRVCLPMVDAPRPIDAAAQPAGAATVVVLEDDPRVRDLIVEILETYDYRALRAASADAALALCGRDPNGVALVVAAVRALGRPGFEFADWLRAVAPNAKILYLSDEPGNSDGAPTLVKPFAVDALVDAVRSVLRTPTATG